MKCRHCQSPLDLSLIDLGTAPPSNAYLTDACLNRPERWFPLRVLICTSCWLVQTEDFAQAEELFDAKYAYFSGFSTSWLAHSERYVNAMVERFKLDTRSHVVEVAANDGYLLQYVKAAGVPCTGVEPTRETADAARARGIPIVEAFFGRAMAERMVADGQAADLTAANNVLAHVPDINDFVAGFAVLLKPDAVATFEFPHLMRLIDENQFDTIYHEHFSYLSLTAVDAVFTKNGLSVFDVEQLPTHGGSLRVYAQRSDTGKRPTEPVVASLLRQERDAGMTTSRYYAGFQNRAETVKNDLLGFLLEAKAMGKTVAGYGAAAKGNTLLNFAGVRPDLVPFVVDRNPAKQNKFMPGSRIPIVSEHRLHEARPDHIVILPWNLREEITQHLAYARQWGAEFVTAVPSLRID